MQDQSLNRLYALVRNFAQQTPAWGSAIRYFTRMDERFDLFRVSRRVYGRDGETMVIQAAAGLDSPEHELTERLLVLPTEADLRAFKLQAGFDASEI